MDAVDVNPEMARPFWNRHRDAVMTDLTRATPLITGSLRSAVVALLSICCPSAVPRFVVAIGVNPVERCSDRSGPHVAKEGRERCAPFIAHRDTATAIAGIARMCLPKTSRFRRMPRTILTRPLRTRRAAMFRASRDRDFVSQTAAATAVTSSQRTSDPTRHGAAFAAADPPDATDGRYVLAENSPSAESLSSHVFEMADHLLIVIAQAQAGMRPSAPLTTVNV